MNNKDWEQMIDDEQEHLEKFGPEGRGIFTRLTYAVEQLKDNQHNEDLKQSRLMDLEAKQKEFAQLNHEREHWKRTALAEAEKVGQLEFKLQESNDAQLGKGKT